MWITLMKTLTFYNACQKDVHRLDTDFNLNLQFYNCKKRNYIYSKFENFDRLNLKDYDELCFVLISKPHEQPCNRRLKGPTMRTD